MKRYQRHLTIAAALVGLSLMMPGAALAQRAGGYGGGRNNSSSSSSTYNNRTDGGRLMGSAIIQYDPDTASIIVIADEETNGQIEQVIRNLDRPAPQVLIKVVFLEVTHTDAKDLGVEGKIKNNHGDDLSEISTIFGLVNETQGGFYKIIESDLEATLRAIAENTKLEVLSRPSVLTRNNQQAQIMVGQQVPLITSSRILEDGQQLNSIDYTDIGIILNVTPHIAPERMVEMQIAPEISNLTAETVPISSTVSAPVISKRAAETRVLVGDGKTVVIGGLMGNNKTNRVTKVPLLGDIPYVGALFRRTREVKSKTELLIFLTPLVVDNPEELQSLSEAEQSSNKLPPKAFSKRELDQYSKDPRGAAKWDEEVEQDSRPVLPKPAKRTRVPR